jgi:N-methylhydantoinase A
VTYRLGVDIGGTFTDIVLLDDRGGIRTKKLLSSPPDYSEAIETGVRELLAETGIAARDITEFLHGTTVVTNTIIERKGSRIALVTTTGFRDVLELGRFRTSRLYDASFRKPDPLVERRLRLEVTERTAADGTILKHPDTAELDGVVRTILNADVEAVAVCFINAYANGENEAEVAAYLQSRMPHLPVSASSQLLPQIQEYERTSTTVVNAYVRPVAERYINALQRRLTAMGINATLTLMQSSGGSVPGTVAAVNPITIIESGPAAGVVGAQRLAIKNGLGDLMVLDVGGTTAKSALIQDGIFSIATETEVGGAAAMGHRLIQGAGYAVQAPSIDIAEVGAGGGSIAVSDAAGGMRVGPHSAGAVPGPVCYDRGGTEPTVTDANLLLGYISPTALVGGDLTVNAAKAEAAVAALASKIGLSTLDTAYGIFLIANSNMMRALSGVSSERGQDPSRFTLFAIGGNGGVHGTKLAEDLRMTTVIVPPVAGVFSALGMLFTDVEHQIIQGYYKPIIDADPESVEATLVPMRAKARAQLAEGGFPPERQDIVPIAEIRYAGQTTTLPVQLRPGPVTSATLDACAADFAAAYRKTYGYDSPGERPQFVALKVLGRGLPEAPRVPSGLHRDRETTGTETKRRVYFGPEQGWFDAPVISRASLGPPRPGPLIVEEYDSTSVVRPGWTAEKDAGGSIIMRRAA